MAFNVLSGSITAHSLVASGSFSGSFRGNGEELDNVKQFDVQNQGDQRLVFYKLVNGEYQLNSNTGLTFNSSDNTLLINGPKVGIGTTSPEVDLDIQGASNANLGFHLSAFSTTNSTMPYIYLRKSDNNTVGTKTQTDDGDYLGQILFGGVDSNSNYQVGSAIDAVQDGASGASKVPSKIVFRTATDSASATERMVINSAGNVGIGIASPSTKLDVVGNLKVSTSITASTARLTGLAFGTATTASFLALDSNNNIVLTSSVGGAGGGGGGDISYSRRFISAHATASVDDTLIGISASAPLGIQLPSAGGYTAGQYFTIKDEAGNCNIHNITIFASGSQTIDGVSSILLESPYAAVNIYSNGSNKFFIY